MQRPACEKVVASAYFKLQIITATFHKMHACNCCQNCQQEMGRLRAQNESLLIDYPPLKEKARLARQTLQLYKDENEGLHRKRIELEARVAHLQGLLGERKGVRAEESADGRREGRKVDQLNRVIACKNSEIASLKQEASWRNYEIHTLQYKIDNLNAENAAIKAKMSNMERPTKDTAPKDSIAKVEPTNDRQVTITQPQVKYQPKITYLSDPTPNPKIQTSAFAASKLNDTAATMCTCCPPHSSSLHADKSSNYRLNLIQSKIEQLEMENSRLRQNLVTRI